MDTTLLVIQGLNGLQLGLLLFLVASGLTLVFGILDFVNLAHGSLYMVGAFICASLTFYFDSFLIALVISLPLIGIFGYLFEIIVARKLYERDHLDHVLGTFGAILVNYTRLGMLIRAGASNRTMVSALGVDIKTLFSLVFAMGAVLAGLAGMLIAPITEASLGMGNNIIITAFVVIIVGGIGSMKGAFIAAIIIGVIDTLGRAFLDDIFALFMSAEAAENSAPAISSMLIYLLMASVLYFKPAGLFPPKVR